MHKANIYGFMDFVWKIPVCYEIRIRGKPAETSLESFVKSLQVNLYLAGFSNLEPLCSRTKATRFLPKLWRGFRLWQKTSSDWQLRPRKMLYLHVQQGIVQPLHLRRWVKNENWCIHYLYWCLGSNQFWWNIFIKKCFH